MRIEEAWSFIESNDIFVLMKANHFSIENPIDDEDREATLRIFLSYEECIRYCEEVQSWYPGDSLQVRQIGLIDLFGSLEEIEMAAVQEFGCPAKLVICKMSQNEWPSEIDVLWSAFKCLSTIN